MKRPNGNKAGIPIERSYWLRCFLNGDVLKGHDSCRAANEPALKGTTFSRAANGLSKFHGFSEAIGSAVF